MIEQRQIPLLVCGILVVVLGAFLWSTALSSADASGTVLYVAPPPDGDDDNPCSLGQPCATLQHAVDVASSGDELRVATGTYTGVQARGAMTQVLYISTTVSIRGGYSAGFGTWDPLAYPTTLDAAREGRVVSIVGAGITATLDSLVISGGDATGITTHCPAAGGQSDGCGGGIFVHQARAFIVSNVITDNVAAVSGSGRSASGGGICLSYATGTVISDNLIIGNFASLGERGMGGGIHLSYPYSVQVISNRLIDNVATTHASLAGWGGGIAIQGSGAAATISGNQIEGNRTNSGGSGQGAGIYHSYGASTMTGNQVTGNHGPQAVFLGAYGGARFEANQVISNSTDVGIWLAYGGGSEPTLANNIVARSGSTSLEARATSGAPLTARLVHNTLAGAGTGYGVHVGTAYVTLGLTNTIVAGHALGITNSVPASSTVLPDHTLFWNIGQDGISGVAPVYGDPAFIDPGGGDYHLGTDSAAMDAAVDAGEDRDVDGDPRPMGLAPDIGADEARRWIIFLPLVLRDG
ncbi:MAG: right-handed parallel beta-helix repeat-containing protein [Anaerolineae bacterium]